MTRINAGIEVWELPDKLLLAEHREITRIPNAVRSGRAKVKDLPVEFKLGTGHVKFFYDKLPYLAARYAKLYTECVKRGFAITDKSSAFVDLPPNQVDYVPSERDRKIVFERISSKGFVLRQYPGET